MCAITTLRVVAVHSWHKPITMAQSTRLTMAKLVWCGAMIIWIVGGRVSIEMAPLVTFSDSGLKENLCRNPGVLHWISTSWKQNWWMGYLALGGLWRAWVWLPPHCVPKYIGYSNILFEANGFIPVNQSRYSNHIFFNVWYPNLLSHDVTDALAGVQFRSRELWTIKWPIQFPSHQQDWNR